MVVRVLANLNSIVLNTYMKIKIIFAWYDIWVGVFYDRKNRIIYILPIPMVGLKISLPDVHLDDNSN